MADLYVTMGKHEISACLIGWADSTREKLLDTRFPLDQADVDKIVAACMVKMGGAAFSGAYERGKKLSLDEAVALALEE
jgi:hypothetical protein